MKKLLALCTFALLSATLFAGELSWETSFEKAKKLASQENKAILINFTGSDWCGWCKRLDREVFRKDSFSDFVDEELVLLKVDFPRYNPLPVAQQKANRDLANRFGVRGFPAIFLVDKNGKVLLETGYQAGGADSYISHLKPHIN